MRKKGFTLLELLIVIAVMLVLAALLVPAFFKVQNEGRKRRAEVEASVIESAIRAYMMRERRFPVTDPSPRSQDVIYGDGQERGNVEVMNRLRNANPPVLDEGKLRWDQEGNAINPWGRQYRIWLDMNYDGWLDLDGDDERQRNENREFYVQWNLQQ